MTDEDYVFFNSNEDDNNQVSSYDDEDNDDYNDNLVSKLVGRYHFVKDRYQWRYRSIKWHARNLSYRLKNGSFPDPIEHRDDAIFKYGYLWAWYAIDEINFIPQRVNEVMSSLLSTREAD